MSFSLETVIMIAAVLFCVGGLVGAVISRTLAPPSAQRDLEQRLGEARLQLEQYERDVSQHFADTAKLVGQLTRSYREVHDHLAKGAIQFAAAEVSKSLLETGDEQLGVDAQNALEQTRVEPPRDWAPKIPGQAGTLSEEFGLSESRGEEGIEHTTARPGLGSTHPGNAEDTSDQSDPKKSASS